MGKIPVIRVTLNDYQAMTPGGDGALLVFGNTIIGIAAAIKPIPFERGADGDTIRAQYVAWLTQQKEGTA